MKDEITIWIGTEFKTNLPCKVLQHSILRHSKFRDLIKFYEQPGISWKTESGRKLGEGTGFSLQRWYIPEKFNYEGFCIYLDADMIVFHDIIELWNYRFELISKQRSIACTYQKDKWFKDAPATSAMLIDCLAAKSSWKYNNQRLIEKHLIEDKDRKKYVALMHAQEPYVDRPIKIDISWNRLNKFHLGTKLLHYTEEPKQPWYYPEHPYKDKWRDALVAALEDNYITKEEIKVELDRYEKPGNNCCRGQGLHPYWEKFIK